MDVEDTRAELGVLIGRFFAAVSFTAGHRPAYDTLHELFVEGGLLFRNSSDVPEITTVERFVAPRRAMVDAGELTAFAEVETSEITEVFGNVAHRFGGYGKTGVLRGEAFAGRGVISTQFVRTPDGWRISAMAWDDERPGLTVPARYAGPAT